MDSPKLYYLNTTAHIGCSRQTPQQSDSIKVLQAQQRSQALKDKTASQIGVTLFSTSLM